MHSQLIPAAGLAIVITLCGYMVAQLESRRSQQPPSSVAPAITETQPARAR
jgi:hypothetical protein